MWGMSKNKNKTAWPLFHYKSSIVVISIYIRTLFYFKIETNKKERQGNKKNKNFDKENVYSGIRTHDP